MHGKKAHRESLVSSARLSSELNPFKNVKNGLIYSFNLLINGFYLAKRKNGTPRSKSKSRVSTE